MKRRTNLFYTSGPDSKFLTFSNYTEALSGNIISTDTKMFPSKFLCLKINNLNSNSNSTKSNKEMFIEFLMRYYENKLATIKDNLIIENKDVENIYPLSYLLEAICYITKINDNNELEFDNSLVVENNLNRSAITSKLNNLIAYVGNVSEEDYNGTYTDIICYINLNSFTTGSLELDSQNQGQYISDVNDFDTELNKTILHGWKGFEQEFNDISISNMNPIFDDGRNSYNRLNQIKAISIQETLSNKLEFNIIIPLFDLVNINYKANDTIISETDTIPANDIATKNLPLGIWLYADKEEDTFITLEKDIETGTFPAWSLLISTQFKPFPYSNKIVNNVNTSLLGNSFSTFSEVLTRMNILLDKFNEMQASINRLNSEINVINSKLNNMGSEQNILDLKQKIDAYKKLSENEILDLENKIFSYISNLKWSSVG